MPQEATLSDRMRIRATLENGAARRSIEGMGRERLRICAEERDRPRLEGLARASPRMDPFAVRAAFLCLRPPTVQDPRWSEPRPMPGFRCRVPHRAPGRQPPAPGLDAPATPSI